MNKVVITELDKKTDDRGWLVEILKKEEAGEIFGQIHLTTAYPDKVKGNHYHTRKTEWFCIIQGKGNLVLENIETGEKKSIIISDEKLCTVKIPPNIAHGIKNIGTDVMYLLIYINEPFDPNDPDTIYREVI